MSNQSDIGSGSTANELHHNYLDKLNLLRKQAGLETYMDTNGTTSASSGIGTGSAGSGTYKISSLSNPSRSSNDTDRYSDNSSTSSKFTNEKQSFDEGIITNDDGSNNTDVDDIRKRLERIKHSAFQ